MNKFPFRFGDLERITRSEYIKRIEPNFSAHRKSIVGGSKNLQTILEKTDTMEKFVSKMENVSGKDSASLLALSDYFINVIGFSNLFETVFPEEGWNYFVRKDNDDYVVVLTDKQLDSLINQDKFSSEFY